MGELTEALRRANEEAASRDRSIRNLGSNDRGEPRLSLEEVLGRRSGERTTESEPDLATGSDSEPMPETMRSDSSGAEPVSRRGNRPSSERPVQNVAREGAAARPERISLLDPSTPGAAGARRIAQKVRRRASTRGYRSIVITSSLRGEGKTTTACNLAVALARLDRSESVVLVDLDLRRPSVARSLGLSPSRTLNEVLERTASIEEAILTTDVPGLSVLAPRKGIPAPEPLLASQNLRSLIEELERRYSRVVIDTPPALVVADASSIIEAADAFIFVAKAGNTPTRSIQTALEHLPREKALGCVLNQAREAKSIPDDYYAYYGQGEESAGESESTPMAEVAKSR